MSSDDDAIEVTASVRVPRRELDWTFTPSGGPGGQHANKASTRADLRFDVTSSSAFSDTQRRRVIERLGPEVRVTVDEQRSQLRNRAIAEERLAERLAAALRVSIPRRPTRPTKGSVERRITDKKRRSQTKAARRRPLE